MRFPSMLRRLRNTRGGTRSTRSTPYTPYMPEPPVDPPPVDPPPVDPPPVDPPPVDPPPVDPPPVDPPPVDPPMPPPAAPGAVPIPPTSPSTPVARITSDHQTVAVGDTVSFDGSGSTGRGLKYSWAFGANASPATDTVVKPSCTYGMPGNKTVTLIVTDDRGVESDVATLNIRVIELTLESPATVTRGETATYTATVKPDGLEPTFTWEFTEEHEGEDGPPISEDTGTTNTWSGQMVVSGTITVTATVNGVPFSKKKITPVDNRSWSDDYPPLPTTNNGQGTLPVDPRRYDDLGHTHFTSPDVDVNITPPVTGGPNRGWMFVQSVPTGAWSHSADINQALYNTRHNFYRANVSRPPDPDRNRPEGPIYMGLLAENVEIHEGVHPNPGRYESHASEALDYLNADPINSWAESQVKHHTVKNREAFKKEVTDAIGDKIQNVRDGAGESGWHPQNKYILDEPKWDY